MTEFVSLAEGQPESEDLLQCAQAVGQLFHNRVLVVAACRKVVGTHAEAIVVQASVQQAVAEELRKEPAKCDGAVMSQHHVMPANLMAAYQV